MANNDDAQLGYWLLPSVRAYLARIGAVPRSIKTAWVSTPAGAYYRDIGRVDFFENGEIKATAGLEPTDAEAEAFAKEVVGVRVPRQMPSKSSTRPKELAGADEANVYVFRNRENEVIAWQERRMAEGKRSFYWWTYYSDGRWRMLEPEEGLPLFGLEQLGSFTTVILHEGAKAARAMQNVSGDHPWYDELKFCAHIGWAGGATNPERTDWAPLNQAGVQRVVIIADNDRVGFSAVPKISKRLYVPTYVIQFTDEFPEGFDLADEFPPEMFAQTRTRVGEREVNQYVGPAFNSCLHQATWMTKTVEVMGDGGKPKTVYKLRDTVAGTWLYIAALDRYANIDSPEVMYKPDALKRVVSAYSDVNPVPLLEKDTAYYIKSICYRPDLEKQRKVSTPEGVKLNIYRPSRVTPLKGDAGPWLNFLKRLLPIEGERKFLEKWVATLVARPGVHMHVAVLLLSQMHGTGKSTFTNVLTRLVGAHNTSTPVESSIVNSEYNDWLLGKRLVVVHEIYGGHDWKAYLKLKSYISEKTVTANIKYESSYTVESFANFVLCSNEKQALKIESTDRRIFVPMVTEEKWLTDEADTFYNWFNAGGDRIIMQWALDYKSYFRDNCPVPSTRLKTDIIDSSDSEAVVMARGIAAGLGDRTGDYYSEERVLVPAAVVLSSVHRQIKEAHPRDYLTILGLKGIMVKEGLCALHTQIRYKNTMVRVLINQAAKDHIQRTLECVYDSVGEEFVYLDTKAVVPAPEYVAKLREWLASAETRVEL